MPVYEIQAPDGRVFEIEGPREPTQEEMRQIFSQYTATEQRSITDKIAGGAEAFATMATGAVAEPIAGLMGLARTVTAGPEAGAQRVQEFRQNATYQPRTEAGQEYLQNIANAPILSDIAQSFERGSKFAGQSAMDITGSPTAAAIAEAAPAAIGAYLGAKTPAVTGERFGAAAQRQSASAERNVQAATGAINEAKPQPSVTSKAFKTLSEKEIADVAQADPEFYKALSEVGVTTEPLPQYGSLNPQFRGIAGGLTAIPGSSLSLTESAFRKDLASRATELFKQYGGLDTGASSVKWREKAMSTIDELGNEADSAYNALSERLDRKQQANPATTLEFISKETDDLPLGITDESAPKVLRSAFKQLQPRKRVNPETGETEVVPANYASMDTLRRQVGAAAFKKEGVFKDADSALLKRLYASLTDDLNNMAEAQGLVDEVKQAKAVVTKRKAIEEQMQNLIGDKLQKEVEQVVMGDIKGLMAGGMQRYKSTMSNIPDPEVRQEIIMTSLNNLFKGTRGGEADTFLTSDYIDWHNKTMAKPAIRSVLEKDLPEGAAAKLDALAKIAEGVTRANADKVRTGVVNSLLNDEAGFVRRMVGGVGATGARLVPFAGEAMASAVNEFIKAPTKRSAAAGELLVSPEFQRILQRGVAEGVVTGKKASKALEAAEKNLMKSKKYQAWADTLSSVELQAISSVGLTSFLTSQQQEAQ